ncbi:hypothetical protein B4N89_32940 [Embleya scabrispora]|uniref:DUF3995 domain-containing protein n=1 Tax=Embleya scabrispora TaxID=159449 RepID=A0A1T3NQB8_9ACTN|nr:DUF3995 domain-containing protein [Embleya scabrispora]OPC78925.1 hypothetical protein B4N89_32940 [Embleya scabrispora]
MHNAAEAAGSTRTAADTTAVTDVATAAPATAASATAARRRKGTAVAALLAGDALVHAFWATGATWPADSTEALSQGLLNADVPFTPRVLLPLWALLTTAAVGIYAHSRGRGGRLTALVTVAVATGLTVRAGAGVIWALGVGADPGSTFYRLNLAVYTPVCVVFGYTAARVALDGIVRRPSRLLRTRTAGR